MQSKINPSLLEGPQPDPVEWWYWNGRLDDGMGGEYAYMLALFKAGLIGIKDVYFMHWQVSDLTNKTFKSHFKTFWLGLDKGSFAKRELKASAEKEFSIRKTGKNDFHIVTPQFDLMLSSGKKPLLAGGTGSVDLVASTTKCYSLTRLLTSGKFKVKGKPIPVTGLSWMDHQWSPLTFNDEHAWTWFCFQLKDGTDIMCFEYGKKIKSRLATVSRPDGSLEVFPDVRFKHVGKPWISPKSEAAYPTAWQIDIPAAKIHLACRTLINEQEMVHGPFRYWEGAVDATGTIDGKETSGQGFLELNGVPGKTFTLLLEQALARIRASV